MAKKNLNPQKEFTTSQVGMILEKIDNDFRIFGDALNGLRERIETLYVMVAQNTEDITMIKMEIMVIKKRLDKIEDKLLDNKVNQKEFIILQNKVAVMERQFGVI